MLESEYWKRRAEEAEKELLELKIQIEVEKRLAEAREEDAKPRCTRCKVRPQYSEGSLYCGSCLSDMDL